MRTANELAMDISPQQPPITTHVKSKGGRPRVAAQDKKCKCVKVYFDAKNYRKLQAQCKRTDMSMSALVYELAVNGTVKEAVPKPVLKSLRDIAGMSNNLNQLARMAHVKGYNSVHDELMKFISQLNGLIAEVGNA
jgi:hypothetical protein